MPDAADLLGILESATASLDDRARAGDALAALGDARATAIDRVLVPAGPFLRKRIDEEPRAVHIASFEIDRYPVTVAAYAEFVDETRASSRP